MDSAIFSNHALAAASRRAPVARGLSQRRMPRGEGGFTLLEILLALGILAMLVALAVTNVGRILGGAQDSVAKTFVRESMKTPLTAYRIGVGDYPSTEEGLQALVVAPESKADRWRGPYVDSPGGKIPLDPWGEPYQYRYPGVHNKDSYDLWSKGPDKADGTDDDIGNW
jgi:general secretion pathway protein G